MPYLAVDHPTSSPSSSTAPGRFGVSKQTVMTTHEPQGLVSFPAFKQDESDGEVAGVKTTAVDDITPQLTGADAMDGECKSRPPSPPESGTVTPTLRIGLCPSRLLPIIPPPNYGAVEHGAVFRSAFPQDRNMNFMKLLRVQHVLCLVDTEPTMGYQRWLSDHNIRRTKIDIAPNKDGVVKTTWDSLCQAILFIMDRTNHPLHIHCNQGRHRTGCIIACYRKTQRWPVDKILAEYEAYASPKARPGDVALIRAFDPEAVYAYAKRHGYFDDRHFMRRMDSTVCNIDGLAAALAAAAAAASSSSSDAIGEDWAEDGASDWATVGFSTASSFESDDGIEMKQS